VADATSVDPDGLTTGLQIIGPSADEKEVFQHLLKLRYPNGRTFDYFRESDQPLRIGQEFDAFGRTWRIESDVKPSRFASELGSLPDAFLCQPIGERAL
jgi:hypothetical protein